MLRFICTLLFISITFQTQGWGFYGHQKINEHAVYLLPPQMMVFFKPHIRYLSVHAPDADKRRYMIAEEGPRHYIDLDLFGDYPYAHLPRRWEDAVAQFSEDTLLSRGIVPWHIMRTYKLLINAFNEKSATKILKLAADLGHYISDAHVPLHTSHNHNGQFTNQHGIHGFWESRVPELLAEDEFDFFIGKAEYLKNPEDYIWNRVLESNLACDSVLLFEKNLSEQMRKDSKYAFEERNGKVIRQYSASFTRTYHEQLNKMVERRMKMAIFSTASFWFTAWVNAGQPDLSFLIKNEIETNHEEIEKINNAWLSGKAMLGRQED